MTKKTEFLELVARGTMIGGSPKCRSGNISRNCEKAPIPYFRQPPIFVPHGQNLSKIFCPYSSFKSSVWREWYIIFVMVEIYFKILNIHSGLLCFVQGTLLYILNFGKLLYYSTWNNRGNF